MSNATSPNTPADARLLKAALRQDLPSFIARAFREVVTGTPYLPNWHIEAMAHVLTEVLAGRIRRLAITIPPRHLKSLSVTVAFVAWLLGHDPTRRIIAVSYSDDLAAKHARDCRAILEADWYQELFPETRLSSSKNTETEYETTAGGGRYSTSVGGTLTGRGGNLIILDDPQKPVDALSEPRRQSLMNWFDNTLYSRLDNKMTDPIILVMQRLHPDDLVGHVLQQEPWVQLRLPAIAEADEDIRVGPSKTYHRVKGEVLQPARESPALLQQMRKTMGSAAFAAQYQQEPLPPDGAILRWGWFQRFPAPLVRQPGDVVIQSWDPASIPGIGNDFSVCTTWVIRNGNYYLVDVIREHYDYPALKSAALAGLKKWQPFEIIIEHANTGTSLIQELHQLALSGTGPLQLSQLRWQKPKDSKVARMAAESAAIEAGQVWLPNKARWLEAFRQELLLFPYGRHDDQVDSMSQFLYRMRIAHFDPPVSPEDLPAARGRTLREGWPRPGLSFG
jgi:predicted phage terminase large subunit-like protein